MTGTGVRLRSSNVTLNREVYRARTGRPGRPRGAFRADAAAERLSLQAGTFTGIHVIQLLAPFVLDDMYPCRVC
jgi:hypothetical protein